MKNCQNKKRQSSASGEFQRQQLKAEKVIPLASDLAGRLCDDRGFELVHVEFRRETQGRVLRIYIDKPGGINLDDCSYFSREMGDLLDVYLDSEAAYHLEVSSPGIDRPLVKLEDFVRFKGKWAKIKINQPLEGRKNFKGVLQGVSDEKVHLLVDNQTVSIPYINITKARLENFNGVTECR